VRHASACLTQAHLAFTDEPFPPKRKAKLPATPMLDQLKRIKEAERGNQ